MPGEINPVPEFLGLAFVGHTKPRSMKKNGRLLIGLNRNRRLSERRRPGLAPMQNEGGRTYHLPKNTRPSVIDSVTVSLALPRLCRKPLSLSQISFFVPPSIYARQCLSNVSSSDLHDNPFNSSRHEMV
jgi:hypothetical protein